MRRVARCWCIRSIFSWNWWDDVTVELRFWLPAGSFATSAGAVKFFYNAGDYANIAE